MKNLLFTIKYKGTNYHGWQVQKNALAVQEVFENAVEKILGRRVDIKGCSRTDTGVHANMYCISMKPDTKIPPDKLIMAFNNNLPKDIVVCSCEPVSIDFHARYSVKSKRYIYKILGTKIRDPFYENLALHYPYKIDVNVLNEAAGYFIGTHDFRGFCSVKSDIEDTVRTVFDCSVKKTDELITISITANGFLYNMVRIIAGTLLFVAQGKILPKDIPEIINSKDRRRAGVTAPAHGLYLDYVSYNDEI